MASGFIELTCLSDERLVSVRAETINRVYDMGEENEDGAERPAHTLVITNDGGMIRCTDDYQSVMDNIRLSEM